VIFSDGGYFSVQEHSSKDFPIDGYNIVEDRDPDSATTEGDAGVVAVSLSLINLKIATFCKCCSKWNMIMVDRCESYDRP
jgi:hypothetical protein